MKIFLGYVLLTVGVAGGFVGFFLSSNVHVAGWAAIALGAVLIVVAYRMLALPPTSRPEPKAGAKEASTAREPPAAAGDER